MAEFGSIYPPELNNSHDFAILQLLKNRDKHRVSVTQQPLTNFDRE